MTGCQIVAEGLLFERRVKVWNCVIERDLNGRKVKSGETEYLVR